MPAMAAKVYDSEPMRAAELPVACGMLLLIDTVELGKVPEPRAGLVPL